MSIFQFILLSKCTDIEVGLVDTMGKGEGETNQQSSTDIHALPRVKLTADGSCCTTQRAQSSPL